MYVVTFYSFKGGVGRSMALMNTGVQLAKRGKKVLLVDFDLEAPGLTTFDLARHPTHKTSEVAGIVDYVTEYIATGVAPDVRDYTYRSEGIQGEGSLWFMPVGRQDSDYSLRLNSIDWIRLYEEQEGYLFFEDLRRQWETALAPDYVLIDSRTGHSDVEGLCTRQLPDAVCLLFFPNEQNLNGLTRIVGNIRASNETSRRSVSLHFVVSNVPDIDDEDQILQTTLDRFEAELRYDKLSGKIHHYNSLSLLNQDIFSLSRPNSRLAKEYGHLTETITRENLGDKDAVVALLKGANRDFGEFSAANSPNELVLKLEQIKRNFGHDGEVSYRMATLYEQMGNTSEALEVLESDHVEKSYPTAPMYAARARLHHRNGDKEVAIRDLRAMLGAENADLESFLQATSDMDQLAPDLYDLLPESIAFNSLSFSEQEFVTLQFDGSDYQYRAKARILDKILVERSNELVLDRTSIQHELAITLIALGEFSRAVELLHSCIGAGHDRISVAFNLAMASWGMEGYPPPDLFERVAEFNSVPSRREHDGNYCQCLAITHGVLGNSSLAAEFLSKAAEKIQSSALGREFSAWTYTRVNQREFKEHLQEISELLRGEMVVPRFMRKSTQRRLV